METLLETEIKAILATLHQRTLLQSASILRSRVRVNERLMDYFREHLGCGRATALCSESYLW